MVRRWTRINLICWLLLPTLALGQEPVVTPNQPGTSDTTPPDPTIITVTVTNLDLLSDDPGAGIARSSEPEPTPEFAYEIADPVTVPFIDRAHLGVWNAVWRSAMRMDGWFGAQAGDETLYQQASGSIAPALLWDKFDGLTPRLRFDVDVPLPHMNSRLHAFVGRVNRDEFVTERSARLRRDCQTIRTARRRRDLVWHPLP